MGIGKTSKHSWARHVTLQALPWSELMRLISSAHSVQCTLPTEDVEWVFVAKSAKHSLQGNFNAIEMH
jgi:hypothetical protein